MYSSHTNKRKSIVLPNRTNYFNPGTSRTHNTFMSPDSWCFKSVKQKGYANRLYWHYRYCQDHQGQTFFYTLTYNNDSIPTYMGYNCFNYNDLRYLLNGGLSKILLRKYGTRLQYFVGAELGDGQGERGYYNNPHYHILFFLTPADNSTVPYQPINPVDFRHYIREYWQGFDEDVTGFIPYQQAKKGLVKEGDNLGLVTDFRACMYCAKYVTKDVTLKMRESKIRYRLTLKYREKLENDSSIKFDFYRDRISSFFVYPSQDLTLGIIDNMIEEYSMLPEFNDYLENKVQEKVNESMNEYRNIYSNKCRISQGVGDYALDFIDDKLNPLIQVPDEKGFKMVPIGQYLYRKLFTDVVKDAAGQPIRILNQLGIDYKVNKLTSDINKLVEKTFSQVDILTEDLYNKMLYSDVNTNTYIDYESFRRRLDDIQNKKELYERYAQYKLVYEDRFYALQSDGDSYSHPIINPISDYRTFITPTFGKVDYNPDALSDFFSNDCEGYLAYHSHPYFLQYIRLFSVFDLLSSYLFVENDEFTEKERERVREIERFHKKLGLKEYFRSKIS